MFKIGNKTYIPLDGSENISYTRAGQVVVDDEVIPGRYSVEAGCKVCNLLGLCLIVVS
jgi:hypothetical protein